MKRTIIAMALAGCFAFSVAAQDNKTVCPEGQTCPKANTTCTAVNGRDCKVADNKMYRPQKFTDFAFEGILLDMGQQARIDSLNAAVASGKCCAAKKCDAKDKCCKKCENKEKCCAAKKCDAKDKCCNKCENKEKCCAAKKCDAKGKCCKNRQGDRREYVKKVKGILTPEQYTMFLENIVMMPGQAKMAQMHGRRPDCPRGKELKAMRDCKHQKDGNCPKVADKNADKK